MNAPAKIQETNAEQSLNAQFDAIFAQTTQKKRKSTQTGVGRFQSEGYPASPR